MQPKILSQRLKIAQDFVNEFGIDEIPLVVDDMWSGEGEPCAAQHDNPVDAAYAMWPTRFYVVQGGAVQFKAEPTKEHEVSALPPLDPDLGCHTLTRCCVAVQARAPGDVPAWPAGRARASD